MEKGDMTAVELAERFNVSARTIYRDIDIISEAGIPIYANRGKGGGFQLLNNFTLDKSILTERERTGILMGLRGLDALSLPDAKAALQKLVALFGEKRSKWINIDFSRLGGEKEQIKFKLLKDAILNYRVISFCYSPTEGKPIKRTVEPIQLLFKGKSWYLLAFCRMRQDYDIFKITRMKNLTESEERFSWEIPEKSYEKADCFGFERMVTLKLKIDSRMADRVYDEFDDEAITVNGDGSFTATIDFPEEEWIYGFIMTFGSAAEVLEPADVRAGVACRLNEMLARYR